MRHHLESNHNRAMSRPARNHTRVCGETGGQGRGTEGGGREGEEESEGNSLTGNIHRLFPQ